ncbi:UNKNOWN [Stylonychia lemnae]|uniref:Uncharacterized protein n=1 Tax=Stylonychia lemnae TaxID=5949 RepID=A0A078B7K6_STYLE|nr:UNKNOWN [Stylonychia lemnae]|eukprot:CDW90206.1 UNKNOWN [Stylonychia lemnae]
MKITYLSGYQYVPANELYWYIVVQGKNGSLTDYIGPEIYYHFPYPEDPFEPENQTDNITNNTNSTNGNSTTPPKIDTIAAFFYGIKPPRFIQKLRSTIFCYTQEITDYELPQIRSSYNYKPTIYIQNLR